MSRRQVGFRQSRRWPGGSSFSPLSLSPVLWLRADLGVTLNGSNVSAWADQSGTGDSNKNATQGTAAKQPLFTAANAALNNKPTIGDAHGSGRAAMLATGVWSSAPAYPLTILSVYARSRSAAGGFYVRDALAASSPSQCALSETIGTAVYGYASATWAVDATNTTADGAGTAVLERMNASTPHIQVKSKSPTESVGCTAPTFAPTGFTFCNYYGDTTGTFIGAQIAEVAMFSRDLTAGEISQLMDYVAARYALTVAP